LLNKCFGTQNVYLFTKNPLESNNFHTSVDSSLSWKDHIDQMMIKLNRACYAIRYVQHFMSQDTLRTIFFSYFHYILLYGIIFWGNSAYSTNIFKIKKMIIRIILNAKNRDSSCQLFNKTKNSTIKITIYFFPFIVCCQKIEIYMNHRIQKFITLALDLVLTYTLQPQT